LPWNSNILNYVGLNSQVTMLSVWIKLEESMSKKVNWSVLPGFLHYQIWERIEYLQTIIKLKNKRKRKSSLASRKNITQKAIHSAQTCKLEQLNHMITIINQVLATKINLCKTLYYNTACLYHAAWTNPPKKNNKKNSLQNFVSLCNATVIKTAL
jgi:hypothetical protein